MRNKTLLLQAAILLAPVLIVIAGFYAASFFPIGTFRVIETPPVKSSQVITKEGFVSGVPSQLMASTTMITAVNSNGTVRVNNLA
jgi:hypothetical protein